MFSVYTLKEGTKPPNQVINIGVDGSVSSLQRKQGQGTDLRKLGEADIERASEIIWSKNNQKWYIQLLEPYNRKVTIYDIEDGYPFLCEYVDRRVLTVDDTAYFNEYDHAVHAEILVLNKKALRNKAGSQKLKKPQ